MNSILSDNEMLTREVGKIAEVAGYLWQRGWAEYNGGNISVNITDYMPADAAAMPSLKTIELPKAFPLLADNYFYITGTGKRMRYVATAPMENGAILRINHDGTACDIIADQVVKPTSELPSHLSMHHFLREKGQPNRVVLHTHPTDLVAMSHNARFLKADVLTKTLWAMIPECRIIVPKGVGIVPYEVPGTMDLANATIRQLAQHDVVLWEKHGILAVGNDVIDCFDVIDTLSKSAQIYMNAKMMGFTPDGMTEEQLDELVVVFNLPH